MGPDNVPGHTRIHSWDREDTAVAQLSEPLEIHLDLAVLSLAQYGDVNPRVELNGRQPTWGSFHNLTAPDKDIYVRVLPPLTSGNSTDWPVSSRACRTCLGSCWITMTDIPVPKVFICPDTRNI